MVTLMIKKTVLLAVFIIIGLSVYFIYDNFRIKTPNTLSNQSSKSVTIGWIGPLTGKTEWLGKDGLNSIQLELEKYNKYKKSSQPEINLIIANSPLESTELSQPAYQNMVHNKGAKLLFVVSSDDTKKLAGKALRDHVLLVNPLNNDRNLANLNSNIILIAKTSESLSTIIADRMLSLHQRKVLVIYSTDELFTINFAKNFKDIFTDAGGQVIMGPYSALKTTDFKPILAQGKAHHVDCYLFVGASEMGIAMNQARDMEIKENFYATDYVNNPTTVSNAKGAIEGVQFSDFTYLDGNSLLGKKFIEQFEKKYHRKPHIEFTALQAYDAIAIVIWAINQAVNKQGDFVENIRNAVLSVRDFEGVSGNITIRADGASEGIHPSIYIFRKGHPGKLK